MWAADVRGLGECEDRIGTSERQRERVDVNGLGERKSRIGNLKIFFKEMEKRTGEVNCVLGLGPGEGSWTTVRRDLVS